MTPETRVLIKAALRLDSTLQPDDRERILQGLAALSRRKTPEQSHALRLVTYEEAATRLGGSVRLVHRLARQGVLHKFRLPGRTRSRAVAEEDLARLLTAHACGEVEP